MNKRRTNPNPAFRAQAFSALVFEGVYPRESVSRLHRSLVRHGRRVSYERLATDPWQLGLWPATEAELVDYEACRANQLLNPIDGLPF